MSKSKGYGVVSCKDLDGHNVTLPDFLFCKKEDAASKSFSAVAAFSPCSAVLGSPWKSSTAPSTSNSDKKKTLIFDKNSFLRPVDIGIATAFIARLKRMGFEIYLRVADESGIVSIDDNLSELSKHVSNLAKFDLDKDRELLARQSIPTDGRLFVVDGEGKEGIAWCLAPEYLGESITGSVFYRNLSVLPQDVVGDLMSQAVKDDNVDHQLTKVIGQNLDIVLANNGLEGFSDEDLRCIAGDLPDVVMELLRKYPHKINAKLIVAIVSSRPELAEVLLEKCSGDVIDEDFLITVAFRRHDLSERILKDFSDKVGGSVLREVIRFRPDLAEVILEDCEDKAYASDLRDVIALNKGLTELDKIIELNKKSKEVKKYSSYWKVEREYYNSEYWCFFSEQMQRLSEKIIIDDLGYDVIGSGYPSQSHIFLDPSSKGQTFLHVSSVNERALGFVKSNSTEFSSTVVLRISKVDNFTLLQEFLSCFPKVRHIILSEDLKGKVSELDGCSYEYINFAQFIDSQEAMVSSGAGVGHRSGKMDDIYIAADHSLGVIGDDAEHRNMCKAGEVLSKKSSAPLKVRVEISDGDIISDINRFSYRPKSFSAIDDFRILNEEEIQFLRMDISLIDIYRFNLPLKGGKRYIIPSASAAESLIGVKVDNGSALKIERGDDDFFYVTAQKDCKISYVVGVRVVDAEASYQDVVPKSHPIRKVIDEYKDESSGFSQIGDSESLPEYDKSTHKEWMEEVFAKRLGVCRHRVAAVEYKLRNTKGVNQEDIRVVAINGNHVALEIRYEGKWYNVDLGGGALNLVNSEEEYAQKSVDAKDAAARAITADRGIGEIGEILERDEALLKSMRDEFSKAKRLKRVSNQADLLEKTVFSDSSRILIVAGDNIDEQANFIIEQSRKKDRRPVFYIDSPSKIDFDALSVRIDQDSERPFISKKGLLEEFIISCSKEEGFKVDADSGPVRPLLLINWSAFSEQQIAALNTLINRERRIHNVDISDRVQVVGLCKTQPRDYSFLSRHEECVSSTSVKVASDEYVAFSSSSALLKFDLQGFPDYRENLFGRVVLVGDHMEWQKSDFVKGLESGCNNFEISNVSKEGAEKLRYEINQAKALGYFEYQGFKISAPRELDVSFSEKSFEFGALEVGSHRFRSKVCVEEISADTALVNSHLFDMLLHGKNIDAEGNYSETDGLIKEIGKRSDDKNLKLFISSELSESQWYCLFYQAEKYGVALDLYLADGVNLPKDVALRRNTEDLRVVEIAAASGSGGSSSVRFYVSNNTEKTAADILEKHSDFTVIDVEDFSFQDLVMAVNFNIANDNFKDFATTDGSLVKALEAGEKIILKGEFSEDLLQMMHPLLINPTYKDRLIVIVEEEFLPSKAATYDRFKWMSKDSYEICHEESALKKEPNNVFNEVCDSAELDDDSKAKSDAFILARQSKFSEMLQDGNLVRLIGHSGVGKSNLVKSFKASNSDKVEVYNEMTSFEDWVKNDDSGKVKILFIDESNMEDMHFTMFSNMKRGLPCKIFYKGDFHEIDENHKVVFAHNAKEYGGGRFDQKLFDDGAISCMNLQDFPASYIYEKILKESIYEKMSEAARAVISLEEFKEYQEDDGLESNTVRELQEETLSFLSQKYNESQSLPDCELIKGEDFISTDATIEQERELSSAIIIRQRQKSGDFPSNAVGLNGVLVSGSSGCGKSEMIRSVLKSTEIDLVDYNPDDLPRGRTVCYKIDAALPLSKKKEIIIKAFNEGNLVWIDELNTCIDDGLEKILNAAMTGFHPDTAERSENPGFMLISSVNDASYDGRSKLSPAILHRMKQVKSKDLKEYTNKDFAIIIHNWIDGLERKSSMIFDSEEQRRDAANQVAKDFADVLKDDKSGICNLRSLRGILKEDFLMNYKESIAREDGLLKSKRVELESGLRTWSESKISKLASCCGFGQNRAGVFNRVVGALDRSEDRDDVDGLAASIPDQYADGFRLSCFLSERSEKRQALRGNISHASGDFGFGAGATANPLIRGVRRRAAQGFSESPLKSASDKAKVAAL